MIAEDDSTYEDISERNDTLSTAPTVLMGFNESDDRMLDVRPQSHIPGKRQAPKAPPTGAPNRCISPLPPAPKNAPPALPAAPKTNLANRCISPLPPAPKNAPPALPAAPATPTTNYERLHSKVAKVNKLQKIDSNENNEGNLSPRSWFRKNKKDMTMPNNGLSKSKSSTNNVARWDILPILTLLDPGFLRYCPSREPPVRTPPGISAVGP